MKRAEQNPALDWLALCLSHNIGAKTLNNLLQHFNHDLAAIFAASPPELRQVPGIGKTIAAEILSLDREKTGREMKSWRAKGISILTPQQDNYPPPLRHLEDQPLALFCAGDLSDTLWQKAVAIVGTRQPTPQARYLTLQLAMKLARAGYAIVSGLALGIDSAAHAGALTGGGKTIAVPGSGILNIYPEANRQLANRICQNGAILSEVHPYWGANAQRLVSRNRIISGLSRAVILVESKADGGAMYTACFAQKQGRPVYTFQLPASGNDQLIRAGTAVLPRDPDAALQHLNDLLA